MADPITGAILGTAIGNLLGGIFGRRGSRSGLSEENKMRLRNAETLAKEAQRMLESRIGEMENVSRLLSPQLLSIAQQMLSTIPASPQVSPVFSAIMRQAERNIEEQVRRASAAGLPAQSVEAMRMLLRERAMPTAFEKGYGYTEQQRRENVAQAIDALTRTFALSQALASAQQGATALSADTFLKMFEILTGKSIQKARLAAEQSRVLSENFGNVLGSLAYLMFRQ